MFGKFALIVAALILALTAAPQENHGSGEGYPGPEPAATRAPNTPAAPEPEMPATATPVNLSSPCAGLWIDGYGRWHCDLLPAPAPTVVSDLSSAPPPCYVIGQYAGRDVCGEPGAPTIVPPPSAYP